MRIFSMIGRWVGLVISAVIPGGFAMSTALSTDPKQAIGEALSEAALPENRSTYVDHATDPCFYLDMENGVHSGNALHSGVNPSTGLPMSDGGLDVGGNAYGSSSSSSD